MKRDKNFVSWLKTAEKVKYKVSVCTGALLLGAAGFLNGKRATTNPALYDSLVPYCGEVVKERIVRDGDTFTSGGISTAIDLGLYLLEYFKGSEAVKKVQKLMDYPYYQPGQYKL